MSPSSVLAVEGLSSEYDRRPVLDAVTFRVEPGEVVALLGPNGSGKTTLLRVIAGLEPSTAGSITLQGRPIGGVPPHRRGIGFLFQEPTLFPGRTVAENIAYGLEIARRPGPEIDERVGEMLRLLRLTALAERPAEALSGGERQRVALARTLAPRPALVLLDEPFASVDPELRSALRHDFQRVLRAVGTCAVHVTHDPEEGLELGDRVLLLRSGRIIQSGRAAEVFEHPVDPESARFLGYQLVPVAGGVRAFHPRELERTGPDRADWAATVEAVRPGLGEWRARLRLPSGDPVEWRLPAGAERPDAGAVLHFRARRPIDYPGSPGRSTGPVPSSTKVE